MIERKPRKKIVLKRKKVREKINNTILKRAKIRRKANKNPEIKAIRRAKAGAKLRRFFLILVILGLITLGGIFFWVSTLKIPDINEIHRLKIAQSTKIYDKTGKILLYNVHGDETRTVVPISKMSKHIKNAAVAIEDKDFYIHDGIKPTSIIKAAFENAFGDRKYKRGGSTITQQVIKNTILTREKTYTRKVKEAILAYKLEKLWTKDQILELYLNESPYGGTLYGIEEASLYYFDKHAADLDIAEAAYLASMPQAPTTYSPYGKNRKALDNRKDLVLSLMLNQGYITAQEYKDAKNEEVKFVFKTADSGLKAPHFVFYVIDKLEEMYGKKALKEDGLKVITTLDYELQQKLQKIVKDKILANEKKYGVENGAVVAIETKTGNILAMVGSRDYFDDTIDGKVNIAVAKRQPGSSFKPYVYVTAFQKGYTPETVVWDVDTEFALKCDPAMPRAEARKTKGCYRPNNFDSYKGAGQFKGPIQLKNALPESRNIPAIKTLYLVGVEKAIANAKLFGIKSLNKRPSYYGLNLVLGGGEVKLLNHVSAYGTFANEGIRVEPTGILEVKDADGKVVYEHRVERKRVIDSKYVKNLNKILSTDSLKYPTFGYNSDLYFGGRVASKTGTTNDNKDSWTMGYDHGNVAVGVWVGNNDNRSAKKNPGSGVTYKIWRASMIEALKKYPNVDFPSAPPLSGKNTKPSLRGISKGGSSIFIDIKTGGLADENTPEEFIKEIVIPSYHSILHWVDRRNPTGPVPKKKDPAYEHWEYGVQNWVTKNSTLVQEEIQKAVDELLKITGGGSSNTDDGNGNVFEGSEQNGSSDNSSGISFDILSPGDGDTFKEEEDVFVKMKQTGTRNIKSYYIYVNGKYVSSINSNKFSFAPIEIDGIKKVNVLKIVAKGKSGGQVAKSITFNLK